MHYQPSSVDGGILSALDKEKPIAIIKVKLDKTLQ